MTTTTKIRIIETAEVLFATHGYEGTSLRDITDRADVNVAAVNYHFGSKEGLLVALLDRVIVPINRERTEMLDRAESAGEPDLDQILDAFLRPDVNGLRRLRERDPRLPAFVSRMYSEPTPVMQTLIDDQFAYLGNRFGAAFSRVLPDLDPNDLQFRLTCIVGIVVYMFAGVSAPGMTPLMGDDLDRDLRRLLAVSRSIMLAPWTEVVEV